MEQRELTAQDRAVLGAAPLAAAWSSESVRSAVSRLLTMVVAVLVFVLGVLLPDVRDAEALGPAWLSVPGLLSVFVLPLLAFGSAVGAVHRLVDRRSDSPAARRLEVCIVAIAAASFLLYFSPWGGSAVRWAIWVLE